MEFFEKIQLLNINTSPLGLEQGSKEGGYFCTPAGAEVIGWAGVDGIHFCRIEGFGDMVFSVSPANLPGDYVHPLARSFEDFLRLLLACGDTAALEQAHMWDQAGFDEFLRENGLPTSEQRGVLDTLAKELGLTPMEEPFAYMKKLQAEFDYGSIPYGDEYYDLVGREPLPPERPEWKVYFDGGFWPRTGRGKPGTEIPVRQTFSWAGNVWHVPAVYVCGAGLVVDFCMEIEPDRMRAFWEKWRPWTEEGWPLTPEDEERQVAENPMGVNFDARAVINGKTVRQKHGLGFGWTPASCRPEWEQGELTQQDYEGIWLMERYGLDQGRCWMFWRAAFPWATKTKPKLKTLTLSLEQNPVPVPGPRFTVSGAGESIPFTHPVTGEGHTLYVAEYEQQEISAERLALMEDGEWEYPSHYTAMVYAVWPELPKRSVAVRDCGEGDRPRRKAASNPNEFAIVGAACVGVIGGADGPTAVLLTGGKSADRRAVCSALRFQPAQQIEWRLVFYQKTVEDIEVELPML